MKQGTTKKLAPKDKHTTEWWKRRDAGRKERQEAYAAGVAAHQAADEEAAAAALFLLSSQQELALFEEDHLGVVRDTDGQEGQGDPNAEARASENI